MVERIEFCVESTALRLEKLTVYLAKPNVIDILGLSIISALAILVKYFMTSLNYPSTISSSGRLWLPVLRLQVGLSKWL